MIRIKMLEEEVSSHRTKLDVISPTLKFIRKGFPYVLIFLILVIYWFVRPYIEANQLFDFAAILVSVILAIIALIYQQKPRTQTNTTTFNSIADKRLQQLPPFQGMPVNAVELNQHDEKTSIIDNATKFKHQNE